MISPEELEEIRQVAETISDFRAEVMDKIRENVEKEVAEMEASDYDPARGRGRGPAWAEGGAA